MSATTTPATTHNMHWNIAAAATAIAGVALVLLQPQWWEGALYTVFQCSIVLWLRPRPQSASAIEQTDTLIEEIRGLHNRIDEQRDLLGRVLPLWDEQIQQAQDQLNMPGTQVAASAASRDRINLIINAVRADMHRLCEIAGHEHNSRVQPDNWLSTFASAHTLPRHPKISLIASANEQKNRMRATCGDRVF